MAKVLLDKCAAMRVLCNEYLADALYYFTEEHGQMIIDVVVDQLNTRYDEFMTKYPSFTGQTVVVGFSLGGVCCFDILARQSGGVVNRSKTDCRTVQPLKFQPSRFFTFGSPIAAVMIMRGWEMQDLQLPAWCRHQNITHPCDPLAYRVEPLIMEKYADIPPIQIDHLPPRSRRQALFDWMSPRAPTSFIPGVGYAYRFFSAFAGYMYGSSDAGSIKSDGDENEDKTSDEAGANGEEPVRHYRKRRRVSESSEEPLWSENQELLNDTESDTQSNCNIVVLVSDDSEEEEEEEKKEEKEEVDGNDDVKVNSIAKKRHRSTASIDIAVDSTAASIKSSKNANISVEIIDTATIASTELVDQDYVHIDIDTAIRYATEDPKPLDQRIDFILYEPRLRTLNEYVIGIRAHFSYWHSRDLMRHLLRCLGVHPIPKSSSTTSDTSES
ncbi:DDHD domain-containing protein [Syncephalis fuscata]|nr:DDHD domain-containing protein [Syncephalis fuscata]